MMSNTALSAFINKVSRTLDLLFDPIFIIDPDLKIVWANKATKNLVVTEDDALYGTFCHEAIHGKETPIDTCLAKTCIEKKEHRAFTIYEPKLGGWFNINISPIFDDHDNIIGAIHIAHDINALKRYQEELKETREILSTIIESSPDLICFKDRNGRLIEANKAYLDAFELSHIHYKGKKTTELAQLSPLPKIIFDRCEQLDQEALSMETPLHTVERFDPPGRAERVLDVLKIPLFNPDGSPKGLIVIGRDITELESEHRAIKELSKRQQAILDHAPVGIVFLSPDKDTIFVNKKVIELFFINEGNLEDLHGLEGQLYPVPEIGQTVVREKIIQRPDGSRFWARITGALVDPKEPQKGTIWIIEDIEREKALLEELKRNEYTFRSITELASDAIVLIDSFGKITFWNTAAQKIFGYSKEEAIGKDLHLLLGPVKVHKNIKDAPINFKINYDTKLIKRLSQFSVQTKEGKKITVELSLSIINLGGNRYALGLIRDVTERLKAEEEKRRLNEKAQKMQFLDSLSILARGIAHDFNNLLMGISGFADLILMDSCVPEKIKGYAKKIHEAVKTASSLTQTMLAYTGEQCFIRRPVDVRKLIMDMGPTIRTQIPKTADFKIDLPDKLPMIEGDPIQLTRAVNNLVINAAESLDNGKGSVELKVYVTRLTQKDIMAHDCIASSEAEPGWYLCISCTDTGKGMDEQTIKRIFEPFYTTKFFGRGLGLTLVLGVVKAHKGAIQIKSRPKYGSCFRLFFPFSSKIFYS
ncbi:PAS domain-containing sensor histidine kinase [Dissulfuribacter thermophilus]|nr:PAS domain S-box protein [Dissulfuribacter thermophilus]